MIDSEYTCVRGAVRKEISMTLQDLVNKNIFSISNLGDNLDLPVVGPYCCDLLSIAMGKAPAGSAWVTVMGNINTIAVASLTEVACIILAEGASLDDTAKMKAKDQNITVLSTEKPIFEAALSVYQLLNA